MAMLHLNMLLQVRTISILSTFGTIQNDHWTEYVDLGENWSYENLMFLYLKKKFIQKGKEKQNSTPDVAF